MDLRSFVIDLTTEDGDPGIGSFPDILLRRLLEKHPIDTRTPRQVQPVGREERRGSVDGTCQVGIRDGAEAFESVRRRGASSVLNQLIVDLLVFLTVRLEKGARVA